MAQQTSPPSRQIRIWIALGLMVAITGALIAAYVLLGKRDMAVLAANLRPEEAAAVARELDTEGVPYQVTDEGTALLVPSEQRDAVRLKVAGADLPIKGQEGFELFDSSELGLTEFAQRIKYQRALQGELARTIMKIDGVIGARIHISIPEQSVFKSERSPAKAAVTLLTRAPGVETREAIAGIQELVASSIPDLDARDVVVLNGHGAVISARLNSDPALASLADLQAAVRAIVPNGVASLTQETGPQPTTLNTVDAAGTTVAETPSSTTILHVQTPALLEPADRDRVSNLVMASRFPGLQATADIRFDVETQSVVASPSTLGKAPREPVVVSGNSDAPLPPPVAPTPFPLVVAAVALALFVIAALAAFAFAFRRRTSRLSITDQRNFAAQLRLGLQAQSQEVQDAA